MIKTKKRRSRVSKSRKTGASSLGRRRKLSLKRKSKIRGKRLGKPGLKRRLVRKKRKIVRRRVSRPVPVPVVENQAEPLPFEGDPSPAYQHAYNEAYQHGFNSGFNQGLEDGHKLAYQARI